MSTAEIPEYVNSNSEFGLQATIGFSDQIVQSTNGGAEPILFLGESVASPKPRYAFSVKKHPRNSISSYLALEYFDTELKTLPLARSGWNYEMPFPQIEGAMTATPQSLYFIDENTIAVSAHYNNTESKIFKIDLTTSAVTGQFTFGLTDNRHVSGLARDANGDVWVADYLDERLAKIDLDQSFATGMAVLSHQCDFTYMDTMATICFVEINGIDYLLVSDYNYTANAGHMFLVDTAKLIDGYIFHPNDAYKTLLSGVAVQGATIHNNSLYISRPAKYDDATLSLRLGYIERYDDIVNRFINSTANQLLIPDKVFEAPSSYPEECKFRPNTDEIWAMTEGWLGVNDNDHFLAIWSSKLNGKPVDNTYTVNRVGDNHTLLINGYEAYKFAATPSVNATTLSIGGYPSALAGMQNGFSTGSIKNVALSEKAITSAQSVGYQTGIHENNSLTVVNIPVIDGVPAWTNDVGSIAIKDTNGRASVYFGGANLQTIAHQRFSIEQLLGAATVENAYAIVRWDQSSYNASDECSMGLATLDSAVNEIARRYSAIVATPLGANWYRRNVSIDMQSNVAHLDIVYRSDRKNGTNNDGYVDAISAEIYIK